MKKVKTKIFAIITCAILFVAVAGFGIVKFSDANRYDNGEYNNNLSKELNQQNLNSYQSQEPSSKEFVAGVESQNIDCQENNNNSNNNNKSNEDEPAKQEDHSDQFFVIGDSENIQDGNYSTPSNPGYVTTEQDKRVYWKVENKTLTLSEKDSVGEDPLFAPNKVDEAKGTPA